MISFAKNQHSPIGIDIGTHSVKLVQMNGDRSEVLHAARWDLPAPSDSAEDRYPAIASSIKQAYESRRFSGREAVVCLGAHELFVQNVRVTRSNDEGIGQLIDQEAASKVPYPIEETEIRFLEAADVMQGELARREIILLACHRPILELFLQPIFESGLRPVAVDVEPIAILRCYAHQFRRDADQQARVMYVHIGATNTAAVIAQGAGTLFVKYIDIGGQHLDEAVARSLGMEAAAAGMLRTHNGDRRRDQQDPEVTEGVATAIRPVIDRLSNELSLCIRYHSVTFRGTPLSHIVLGGGEATDELAESLAERLSVPCEAGKPFRTFRANVDERRQSQWDVATGLALREAV
jgi:type IV pilus assembly protein PilM